MLTLPVVAMLVGISATEINLECHYQAHVTASATNERDYGTAWWEFLSISHHSNIVKDEAFYRNLLWASEGYDFPIGFSPEAVYELVMQRCQIDHIRNPRLEL